MRRGTEARVAVAGRRRLVWSAILRQRCPRCRDGRVFAGSVRMNPRCPACELVFEREPGYFLGAMYFSYALAVAAAVPVVAAGLLLGWALPAIGAAAAVELVILAPWLFRVSRVLWLHLDHAVDPW